MSRLAPSMDGQSYGIGDEFWRTTPAYADLDRARFLDPHWQSRNTIRSIESLASALGSTLDPDLAKDAAAGQRIAPMALRITPYIVGLIDWKSARRDPLRRQFLPLASEREPDHPASQRDSLNEVDDSPVPGLVRRYPDKALFLPLNTCPVYCALSG